jgi:iron-sulfur cluster repair protein YtfE (RIC family)
MSGWISSHDGFRSAVTQLAEFAKRLSSDVDSVMKQLENIESSLNSHGKMEESSLFPFLKKEFASFEKYDASLESQHDRAHQLAGEIVSHCLVGERSVCGSFGSCFVFPQTGVQSKTRACSSGTHFSSHFNVCR